MSPENIHNQEEGDVIHAPQPFNPDNKERIAALNEKFEGAPEFGELLSGPETSAQFEGSKIFNFDRDGKYIRYALRRNADGNLEGNEFTLLEKKDGVWGNSSSHVKMLDDRSSADYYKSGPTYQMHGPALAKMDSLLKSRGITI